MEVYDCLRSRLTIRSSKPDPVPDEMVTRILQAGRWAPSSRNLQPWHFIVIRDREALQEIGRIATSGSFVAQAPLAIAIVMEDADRPELDARVGPCSRWSCWPGQRVWAPALWACETRSKIGR